MQNPFQNLLDRFQSNAYPAMIEDLANHLGVAPESVRRIAPGWVPIVTFKKGPNYQGWWAIPARDDCATVVGLGLRSQNDSKLMYPGSKLGLIYEVNPDHQAGEHGYNPGRHNWVRTMEAGVVCPVCGKPDGCLLSVDNVADPKAVQCIRVPSAIKRGISWLHIRKAEGNLAGRAALAASDLPVVTVEGFSDTATALDLGFQAVGRPSDQAGMALLCGLLRGRSAWVIGENDKKPDGREPGREGMVAAFQNLSRVCSSVRMILPPAHAKDLRDWRKKDGITQADLIAYVKEHGQDKDNSPVIQDDRPSTIAVSFLDSQYRQTGRYLLRQWEDTWYEYREGKYEARPDTHIEQPLYLWAKNKLIVKEKSNGEQVVLPVKMDISLANNTKKAMMAETLLPLATIPCWVNGTQGPEPKNVIVFNNGILDVEAYIRGEADCLIPHTPDLFSTVALPFAFDPTARCPTWNKFLLSSLGDEPDKITLLQEWFGYCMTADTSMQKLMYFRGLAGSGKGTTLRVLHSLIGKGQGAATSFADLAGDFGLKPLLGKLICTIGDARSPTSGTQMRGLELLLMLSGEDNVQVNRKNMQQIDDVRLIARVTIASNSFIEVPDYEGAMARRLLVIEWNRSFTHAPDTTLSDKLEQELPGIAIWALEGLRTLRQRGRFTTPASSVAAIAEWRTSNSPTQSFVEECCDLTGTVDKARLYDVWSAWSSERGLNQMSRSRFFERLRNSVPAMKTETEQDHNGRPMVKLVGVSLKKWAEKKY